MKKERRSLRAEEKARSLWLLLLPFVLVLTFTAVLITLRLHALSFLLIRNKMLEGNWLVGHTIKMEGNWLVGHTIKITLKLNLYMYILKSDSNNLISILCIKEWMSVFSWVTDAFSWAAIYHMWCVARFGSICTI